LPEKPGSKVVNTHTDHSAALQFDPDMARAQVVACGHGKPFDIVEIHRFHFCIDLETVLEKLVKFTVNTPVRPGAEFEFYSPFHMMDAGPLGRWPPIELVLPEDEFV